MHQVSLSNDGREVHIASESDSSQKTRYHAIWLRDNAWDPKTRAPGNGQRLIALRDIPENTTVGEATVNGEILTLTFLPENKTVDYDRFCRKVFAFGWAR